MLGFIVSLKEKKENHKFGSIHFTEDDCWFDSSGYQAHSCINIEVIPYGYYYN